MLGRVIVGDSGTLERPLPELHAVKHSAVARAIEA